jgi:nucleoside-diphosphate-sugar epimerase
MNIFIIGGTGFISGRLTQILLDEGHHVTIFTRGRQSASFEDADRLGHVHGDRTSLASLRSALDGRVFDAAYDMIAYDGDDSRVAVEALQGHVGRFIHCSTISVYMISDEVRCPITEDQHNLPAMGHWPRNPFGMDYGINKRACENVLWEAHGVDFPVTVLRPTFVSGPEDPTARDYFWIERILDGRPLLVPGSGDHAFQQIYIDDAARAFADVLKFEATRGEAYNVVGDDIYSLNEYLQRLAAVLACSIEVVNVHQDLFDHLPISTNPAGDVFPFNTRRTTVFSLEKIKRDIAYRSTPFEEWMRMTVEWYRDEYEGGSFGYGRRTEELDVIQKLRTRPG